MNLKKIEAFLLVIEKRSFSEAAEAFGRSQPAVSQQIRSLEADLGVVLLDRSSSVVQPTPAGKYVYQTGKRLLEQWEEIQKGVQAFHGILTGTLHIGASTIPDAYLLPQWLSAFHRRYPKVELTVESGDSKEMLSRLQNRQIHVAITASKPDDGEIVSRPVASDSIVMISPIGHPIVHRYKQNPCNLLDYDFVIREEGAGTRESLDEALARCGLQVADLNVAAQVGSTEALIAAVEQGLGISLVSKLAVTRAITAGRVQLVSVVEPLSQKYYFCCLKSQANIPIIEKFFSVIIEETRHREK
jgi:DNA-binding transcriptional LysR family regulator